MATSVATPDSPNDASELLQTGWVPSELTEAPAAVKPLQSGFCTVSSQCELL